MTDIDIDNDNGADTAAHSASSTRNGTVAAAGATVTVTVADSMSSHAPRSSVSTTPNDPLHTVVHADGHCRKVSGDSSRSRAGAVTPPMLPLPSITNVIVLADRYLEADPNLPEQVESMEGVIPDDMVPHLPPSSLSWVTSHHLLSTFALMGLKAMHAAKCLQTLRNAMGRLKRRTMMKKARDVQPSPVDDALPPSSQDQLTDEHRTPTIAADGHSTSASSHVTAASSTICLPVPVAGPDEILVPLLFGATPLPTPSTLVLSNAAFLSLVRQAFFKALKGANENHPLLFSLCREVTERRKSIIILLAGTSGTGKSTLASLLAERLRLSCIVSTDSIRHMLRDRYPRQQHPRLHVSTYEADQLCAQQIVQAGESTNTDSSVPPESDRASPAVVGDKQRLGRKKLLYGYKSQSLLVLHHLSTLLHAHASNHESIIVEGVHLLPKIIVRFMMSLPGCVPFLIFISNEVKHRERFAIRTKYMTLDPQHNRYVSSFHNIRAIQKYLVAKAEKRMIPCIDNTNVDRSVAAIHSVLIRCMPHVAAGQSLFDPVSKRCTLMHSELKLSQDAAWSSKAMQRIIRMKVDKKVLFNRLFAGKSDADNNENEQQPSMSTLGRHDQPHAPTPGQISSPSAVASRQPSAPTSPPFQPSLPSSPPMHLRTLDDSSILRMHDATAAAASTSQPTAHRPRLYSDPRSYRCSPSSSRSAALRSHSTRHYSRPSSKHCHGGRIPVNGHDQSHSSSSSGMKRTHSAADVERMKHESSAAVLSPPTPATPSIEPIVSPDVHPAAPSERDRPLPSSMRLPTAAMGRSSTGLGVNDSRSLPPAMPPVDSEDESSSGGSDAETEVADVRGVRFARFHPRSHAGLETGSTITPSLYSHSYDERDVEGETDREGGDEEMDGVDDVNMDTIAQESDEEEEDQPDDEDNDDEPADVHGYGVQNQQGEAITQPSSTIHSRSQLPRISLASS